MELSRIDNLYDYVTTFAPDIAAKVQENHRPLFAPGEPWHEKLHRALRKPFQGQGDAIMAAVKTLEKQDAVFTVGEMGTGKTLMGALIPWVIMDAPKVIIQCPGHLTKKWVREIKATVPDAEASIVETLSDAIAINAQAAVARGPRYWVVGKERAKLSFFWKPAAKVKERKSVQTVIVKNPETGEERETREVKIIQEVVCPRCGQVVTGRKKDEDDLPLPIDAAEIARKKSFCQCGEALWTADNRRARRFAVADYIKKHLPKGFFDFFIADEVHELKASNSAQGNAFGTLAGCSGKTICLTGTLLGGYATHLFHLGYRVSPRFMKAEGFDYHKPQKFVDAYGVKEVVIRETTGGYERDNKSSKGTSRSYRAEERPGISPELFAHQLLDKAVFLHLEDVASDLPPITEEVIGVNMDPDVAAGYRELESTIKSVLDAELRKGCKRLLGTYLHSLLNYPEQPFGLEPINLDGWFYEPQEMPASEIYPKEQEVLSLVQSELAQGRKCLVYTVNVNKPDAAGRMQEILERHGIKARVLRASVDPPKREQWITDAVKDGLEVLICNPNLVKTGLDLIDFPTIIYMQTGYDVFTLRQSSRRSWRIGQDKPVKVFWLYYKSTMQQRAIVLVGKKTVASQAIEGFLQEDGLASMVETEEKATVELAKSLASGGIEGVETVWQRARETSRPTVKTPEPEQTDRLTVTEEAEPEDCTMAMTVAADDADQPPRMEPGYAGQTDAAEVPEGPLSEPINSLEPEPEPVPEPLAENRPVLDTESSIDAGFTAAENPEKPLETCHGIKIEKVVQLIEVRVPNDDGTARLEPVIARKVTFSKFENASLWVHLSLSYPDRYVVTEETTGMACGGTTEGQLDACIEALCNFERKFIGQADLDKFLQKTRASLPEIRGDHDCDDNQVDEEAPQEPTETAQGAEDEPGRTESHGDERKESANKRVFRPRSSDNVAVRKPRSESRKRTEPPAWRRDPDANPGSEYKWTKAGWRKISQRNIEAAAKREARIKANAWKYEQTVNPGEGFYWVNGYSYNRTLKDGTVKRINVRGHWRRRPARTQQLAKAA